MRHIGRVQSLRELRLDGTKITDVGVRCLSELRGLEHLSLAETAVEDEALAVACRLPTLQSLDLRHTLVTNAGLRELERLSGPVQVRLGGTAVTQDAVDRFIANWPLTKSAAPRVDLSTR